MYAILPYMHPPVVFNFSFLIWTLVGHKQMSLFMTKRKFINQGLLFYTAPNFHHRRFISVVCVLLCFKTTSTMLQRQIWQWQCLSAMYL